MSAQAQPAGEETGSGKSSCQPRALGVGGSGGSGPVGHAHCGPESSPRPCVAPLTASLDGAFAGLFLNVPHTVPVFWETSQC